MESIDGSGARESFGAGDDPAAPTARVRGTITPEDERGAAEIREGTIPAYLYMTLVEIYEKHDLTAFKLYRDRLLADCGVGLDPIATMLVEQLAMAHLNTARLHGRAATTERIDEVRAYANAAAQLAGEFRRGALALKAYREPTRAAEGSTPLHRQAVEVPGDPAEKEGVSRRTGS